MCDGESNLPRRTAFSPRSHKLAHEINWMNGKYHFYEMQRPVAMRYSTYPFHRKRLIT